MWQTPKSIVCRATYLEDHNEIYNSKLHGMLDYGFGVLLIVSPWLFGFSYIMQAKWLAIVMGILPMVYSLLTRYELGVLRLIPMRVHLWFDTLSGALLIIVPWFFAFADKTFIPFVAFGIIEILVASLFHRYANVPGEDPIFDTRYEYVAVHTNQSHSH